MKVGLLLLFWAASVFAQSKNANCPDIGEEAKMYRGECYPARLFSNFVDGDPTACHGAEKDKTESMQLGYFTNSLVDSDQGPNFFQFLKEKIKNCHVSGNPYMPNLGLADYERKRADYLKKEIEENLNNGNVNIQNFITEYKTLDQPKDLLELNLQSWNDKVQKNIETQKKSCSAVDLRDQFGPIRDQQDSGLCFAFVSSELLGFKLHKNISYMDAALQQQEKSRKDKVSKVTDLNSGDIKETLEAAKDFGVCTTDQFPDSQNYYNDIKNAIDPIVDPKAMGTCSSAGHLGVTNNMKNLLNSIQQTQEFSIKSILNKACEPRDKSSSSIAIHSFKKQPDTSHGVDEALSKKLPVGIGVTGGAFGFRGIVGHAMTIVGRKWNPQDQQCQYILRNSWGPCQGYSKKTKDLLNQALITCDGGYLFVNHDELVHMSVNSSYID